jgi:hypothetical protein
MGNAIDTIIRKVNGLPVEVTALNQTETKRLLGRWDDAIEQRWARCQHGGTVPRSALVRQLQLQKEVDGNVDRTCKTTSMAILRRQKAKQAATVTQEQRVGYVLYCANCRGIAFVRVVSAVPRLNPTPTVASAVAALAQATGVLPVLLLRTIAIPGERMNENKTLPTICSQT